MAHDVTAQADIGQADGVRRQGRRGRLQALIDIVRLDARNRAIEQFGRRDLPRLQQRSEVRRSLKIHDAPLVPPHASGIMPVHHWV
jgi:hypothetical protein